MINTIYIHGIPHQCLNQDGGEFHNVRTLAEVLNVAPEDLPAGDPMYRGGAWLEDDFVSIEKLNSWRFSNACNWKALSLLRGPVSQLLAEQESPQPSPIGEEAPTSFVETGRLGLGKRLQRFQTKIEMDWSKGLLTPCYKWLGNTQGYGYYRKDEGYEGTLVWVHPAAYYLFLAGLIVESDLALIPFSNRFKIGDKMVPRWKTHGERVIEHSPPHKLLRVNEYRPVFEFTCGTERCCNPQHATTHTPLGLYVDGAAVPDLF